MSAEALATVALALVAGLGLIIGATAWFYKRGGQEKEFSIALRANTEATTQLTSRLDTFMGRTQDRQEDQERRTNVIDTRLTVCERDVRDLTRKGIRLWPGTESSARHSSLRWQSFPRSS